MRVGPPFLRYVLVVWAAWIEYAHADAGVKKISDCFDLVSVLPPLYQPALMAMSWRLHALYTMGDMGSQQMAVLLQRLLLDSNTAEVLSSMRDRVGLVSGSGKETERTGTGTAGSGIGGHTPSVRDQTRPVAAGHPSHAAPQSTVTGPTHTANVINDYDTLSPVGVVSPSPTETERDRGSGSVRAVIQPAIPSPVTPGVTSTYTPNSAPILSAPSPGGAISALAAIPKRVSAPSIPSVTAKGASAPTAIPPATAVGAKGKGQRGKRGKGRKYLDTDHEYTPDAAIVSNDGGEGGSADEESDSGADTDTDTEVESSEAPQAEIVVEVSDNRFDDEATFEVSETETESESETESETEAEAEAETVGVSSIGQEQTLGSMGGGSVGETQVDADTARDKGAVSVSVSERVLRAVRKAPGSTTVVATGFAISPALASSLAATPTVSEGIREADSTPKGDPTRDRDSAVESTESSCSGESGAEIVQTSVSGVGERFMLTPEVEGGSVSTADEREAGDVDMKGGVAESQGLSQESVPTQLGVLSPQPTPTPTLSLPHTLAPTPTVTHGMSVHTHTGTETTQVGGSGVPAAPALLSPPRPSPSPSPSPLINPTPSQTFVSVHSGVEKGVEEVVKEGERERERETEGEGAGDVPMDGGSDSGTPSTPLESVMDSDSETEIETEIEAHSDAAPPLSIPPEYIPHLEYYPAESVPALLEALIPMNRETEDLRRRDPRRNQIHTAFIKEWFWDGYDTPPHMYLGLRAVQGLIEGCSEKAFDDAVRQCESEQGLVVAKAEPTRKRESQRQRGTQKLDPDRPRASSIHHPAPNREVFHSTALGESITRAKSMHMVVEGKFVKLLLRPYSGTGREKIEATFRRLLSTLYGLRTIENGKKQPLDPLDPVAAELKTEFIKEHLFRRNLGRLKLPVENIMDLLGASRELVEGAEAAARRGRRGGKGGKADAAASPHPRASEALIDCVLTLTKENESILRADAVDAKKGMVHSVALGSSMGVDVRIPLAFRGVEGILLSPYTGIHTRGAVKRGLEELRQELFRLRAHSKRGMLPLKLDSRPAMRLKTEFILKWFFERGTLVLPAHHTADLFRIPLAAVHAIEAYAKDCLAKQKAETADQGST
ncbi:hypothetical protein KIPB_003957 [Kipferlia bialata]|uniref:Uncharacterized protein n=1 Tax=Kipferlia bialata TaxID=797122 RepID=A0A9K3CUW6_9EUKA|nr:hypothetical protein KIPB_003957 [Kipferlia bialata]|eukprot:g3957.t1